MDEPSIEEMIEMSRGVAMLGYALFIGGVQAGFSEQQALMFAAIYLHSSNTLTPPMAGLDGED